MDDSAKKKAYIQETMMITRTGKDKEGFKVIYPLYLKNIFPTNLST
ncbi:hypothetical protein GCM10007971_09040 [Oceanobacillus indicireducens]|uniref:Uncharacterized protein n=1 Tax=Oceanobacillus indicireducens TaxID=1004261 RepID=A0A917XTA6_9BACI|nr:hypothetical protein GCM10007971_09040 [Oceanobacillus indicireducens]